MDMASSPTSSASRRGPGDPALNGRGELILAIDDDAINLEVLRAQLSLRNYRVELQPSAAEALAYLQRAKELPNLILLDIMMPRESGHDFCARLKSTPNLGQIPVIMVTAKTLATDKMDAAKAGAIDFITKPVDRTELLTKIRKCLDAYVRRSN